MVSVLNENYKYEKKVTMSHDIYAVARNYNLRCRTTSNFQNTRYSDVFHDDAISKKRYGVQ